MPLSGNSGLEPFSMLSDSLSVSMETLGGTFLSKSLSEDGRLFVLYLLVLVGAAVVLYT